MNSEPIVQVKQGKLKGKILKTVNGKEYFCFSGIPYAEPPLGSLRFKDPVPIRSWQGIRNATKEGDFAAQYKLFTTDYIGSEDCLYLNLSTPQLKPSNGIKFPVMVNIHGGGFISGSGSSDDFGPDYIVEQNVILVTFNYRLDIFGFLCTDPKNARGDMGLKDQNLVLRWVKENVEAFGGDSNNITIFGISAGSVSVEYHMLSPMSRGLFNKAIPQSGSVLNIWPRSRKAVQYALKLAKILGYNSDNTEGLFEFINKIKTKELIDASYKVLNNDDLMEGKLFTFGPTINEFEGYDGFLNEEPYELLKSGNFYKVPTMSGYCEYEGIALKFFYTSEESINDLKEGKYIKYIPTFLNKSIEKLDEKLRKIYNKNINVKNNDDCIIHFLSDVHMVGGLVTSFNLRIQHNPFQNYFYIFSYDGNINMFKAMLDSNDKGACHGDDTAYLCTSKITNKIPTKMDELIRSRMVKLWTNFAKTGNPTPEINDLIKEKWIPVTKEEFNYLDIGEELKMHKDLIPERMQLWKEIYTMD